MNLRATGDQLLTTDYGLMTIRIGILTISDRASKGVYEDLGGPAIRQCLTEILSSPWEAVPRLIPDEQPVIEATIPSSLDETVAPKGKQVMSMFTQYFPYKLATDAGTLEENKKRYAERCIDIMTEYAPNFRKAVIDYQVLAPADLESTFGLTGGNIMQGAMSLSSLAFMRPLPGYADYRTPVKGLYLCGAATHPGGGVMGACGYNAAREILKDG